MIGSNKTAAVKAGGRWKLLRGTPFWYQLSMTLEDSDIKSSKRRSQSGMPVTVRLQSGDLELLDLWIVARNSSATRLEAMYRMLKLVAIRMPI